MNASMKQYVLTKSIQRDTDRSKDWLSGQSRCQIDQVDTERMTGRRSHLRRCLEDTAGKGGCRLLVESSLEREERSQLLFSTTRDTKKAHLLHTTNRRMSPRWRTTRQDTGDKKQPAKYY